MASIAQAEERRRAEEESSLRAQAEAERLALEQAELQARERAERLAVEREEEERRLREQQQWQREEEQHLREEEQRLRLEQEEKARLEREQREEMERLAHEEQERHERQEALNHFFQQYGFTGVNAERRKRRALFKTTVTYPLHCAAEVADERIVSMLLEEGAEVAKKNSSGKTALQVAEKKDKAGSHAAVLRLLGGGLSKPLLGGA